MGSVDISKLPIAHLVFHVCCVLNDNAPNTHWSLVPFPHTDVSTRDGSAPHFDCRQMESAVFMAATAQNCPFCSCARTSQTVVIWQSRLNWFTAPQPGWWWPIRVFNCTCVKPHYKCLSCPQQFAADFPARLLDVLMLLDFVYLHQ